MSELLWDDVKGFFDLEWEGCLPDVWVTGTTVQDWQAVLDLIVVSGWRSEYSEGGVVMPLPRAGEVLSRPADAECADLRVWPALDVLAVFRLESADEIGFDVDLRAEAAGAQVVEEGVDAWWKRRHCSGVRGPGRW